MDQGREIEKRKKKLYTIFVLHFQVFNLKNMLFKNKLECFKVIQNYYFKCILNHFLKNEFKQK